MLKEHRIDRDTCIDGDAHDWDEVLTCKFCEVTWDEIKEVKNGSNT